ncbi:hypothetical protein Q604_UNBC14806G0001, partial [human gut metagenome]
MQHVQTRSTTSALVLTAVLIALATLFTMYTKIPVPGNGYARVEYKVFGDKVTGYDNNTAYDSCYQGRGSCL